MTMKSFLVLTFIFFSLALILVRADDDGKRKRREEKNKKDEDKPVRPPLKRSQSTLLYYSKECSDDLRRYCPAARNNELNDLAVLQCIYNEVPDLTKIDAECHNVSYSYFV